MGGVYQSKSGEQETYKGIISLPNFPTSQFDRKALKKLAALAPGCTVNIIEGSEVRKKFRLHMPPRIYNFDIIRCRNKDCVSHPSNMQREVEPHFVRAERPKAKLETWASSPASKA